MVVSRRKRKISDLPKIKIKLPPGFPEEEPFPLEEAKTRINFEGGTFFVDSHLVKSYNDLVQLVGREKYRDREFLEVVALLFMAGG